MVRLEVLPARGNVHDDSVPPPGVILLQSRADFCLSGLRGVQNISPVTAHHCFCPIAFLTVPACWLQVLWSHCALQDPGLAHPWVCQAWWSPLPHSAQGHQALAPEHCPTVASRSQSTTVLFQLKTSPAIPICLSSPFVHTLCPKASFKLSFSPTSLCSTSV